ncbi:helix-turn-helix transcriptional regulator [Halegenticoccus tardaugens]|uniref:helix-turn-helix transcriptional regulator n=1 Tax=Halegenticoccus tardaugens TaxID=2071624 RepID=UPI00100A81F4|nr:transcriptional regulator FilR1 domain-containing protein [Halegenticoccus tardaugens]
MDPALEEIEFLALSANRVEVLDALAEGAHSRRELGDRTDASQPTLGRILRDLEERKWIVRTDEGYAATATGRMVAEGFTDLWETVETERRLRDVVEWLPTESMGFDPRRLGDATITVPSRTKPNAPVQRVLELLRRAEQVRILSHAFNEQSLDVIRRRTVEGEQTFKGVFSPEAVEAVADDATLRRRLRELDGAERAEIRIYEGEIPLAVTITDELVHLLLRDDDGILRAALDTDDESVRSWARGLYEEYWRDATPFDFGALDP